MHLVGFIIIIYHEARPNEHQITVQPLFSVFKLATFYQNIQLQCVTPELTSCFRDSSCLDYLSITIDKKVKGIFMLRIEDAASG